MQPEPLGSSLDVDECRRGDVDARVAGARGGCYPQPRTSRPQPMSTSTSPLLTASASATNRNSLPILAPQRDEGHSGPGGWAAEIGSSTDARGAP